MKKTTPPSRRTFIKHALSGGATAMLISPVYAMTPTPAQSAGPFYPVQAQKDKDFDLTRIEGATGVANGKIIIVEGQILDTDKQPIEDASVDIWQANAAGRYHHPHDTNPAPLDPNFQGWAIVQSGKEGRFRFKTIYPGAYPASRAWTRPPHIHYKISKKGYVELVTQMYFPSQPLNDTDTLLQQISPQERQRLIALQRASEPETYLFNIILRRA